MILALGRLTLAPAITVQAVLAAQKHSRIFNTKYTAYFINIFRAFGLYAIEQTEHSNLFDDERHEAFRYSTRNN